MKARVIKEWKMYGITHKVGEIMTISLHSPGGLPMISDRDAFLLDNGFIEEMEEPLIKDEKIRKAVRAWAEANELDKLSLSNNGYEIYGGLYDTVMQFVGEPLPFDDKDKTYTIAELCGEEEE